MTASQNLDELFADAELPFGHLGRNFNDAPEHFDPTPITGQGPEPDYTPDEPDPVVHYAPSDLAALRQPLHDRSLRRRPTTRSPAAKKCLELVAEDLEDHNDYRGRCLHCRQEITAHGGVEWRRMVRAPAHTADVPAGSRLRPITGPA